ncbi:uncharacterized protein LOC143909969 [Arctopsyche grandis]|uniref:uncharacterized protein LOC143909969 n=1 Tax=Arctopsyche grandis TaxID=121162 RepID=UPI00406D9C6C
MSSKRTCVLIFTIITLFITPKGQEISPRVFQDVAFYLRSYKFNEWDANTISGESDYPIHSYFPDMNLLHWEVRKHCSKNFRHCISYLHDQIDNLPLDRLEDTSTVLNRNPSEIIELVEKKCKKNLKKEIEDVTQFEDHQDRYQWVITAMYYMCWYTMKEEEMLKHLNERCDNFAACLDKDFGFRNNDPRADDELPFNCASYSFCPDPCCPSKHLKSKEECLKDDSNPCYIEGSHHESSCSLKKYRNTNFESIIANEWNVSCKCRESGFKWNSQFGICVDVDECSTERCSSSQTCVNTPGSYDCFCDFGYYWNQNRSDCVPYVFVTDYKQPGLVESIAVCLEYLLHVLMKWFVQALF